MSILDEPKVASILLAILEHPGIIQEKIAETVATSRNTLRTLLTKLKYENMVVEKPGERNKKHYYLTKKGEEVAKALKQAREAVRE